MLTRKKLKKYTHSHKLDKKGQLSLRNLRCACETVPIDSLPVVSY